MAYQDTPKIFHSQLVKQGPTAVTITKPVKTGVSGPNAKTPGKPFAIATFTMNGVEHGYFLPASVDQGILNAWVGQSVMLIATGDDRAGTAALTVQPTTAGAPVPQQPAVQAPYQPPQQSPPVQVGYQQAQKPANPLIGAKVQLAKATNLMRICVKKSLDIGTEFGLGEAQTQAIASSLFISGERAGLVESMPLEPFTPADLGANAVQARQHVEHPEVPPDYQPGQDDDGSEVPF